jgi:hypothetical protein
MEEQTQRRWCQRCHCFHTQKTFERDIALDAAAKELRDQIEADMFQQLEANNRKGLAP